MFTHARPLKIRRGRRGFTIVELLVVVGIIAILVSILLPVMSGVRRRARENACANSERTIYHATMLAINDLNGHFPRPASRHHTAAWARTNNVTDLAFAMDPLNGGGVCDYNVGVLWQYLGATPEVRKGIFMCANDRGEIAQGGSTEYRNRNFSYSFNSNIRPSELGATLRLNQVRKPGTKIMLWEEIGPNDGWCTGPGSGDDYPTNRHGQSGVVGRQQGGVISDPDWVRQGYGIHMFFDGHTENLYPDYLMANVARYHSNLDK